MRFRKYSFVFITIITLAIASPPRAEADTASYLAYQYLTNQSADTIREEYGQYFDRRDIEKCYQFLAKQLVVCLVDIFFRELPDEEIAILAFLAGARWYPNETAQEVRRYIAGLFE